MQRTQILLEREQHEALVELAHKEGRSVSDVVREMLREQLEERRRAEADDLTRYLEALERIKKHREAILARRGGKAFEIDVAEEIHRMREERDEEILRRVYNRAISPEEGQGALEDLFALQVEAIPMSPELCRSALAWAERLGQARAYDAFYLALAEQFRTDLWTADRRLGNAAQQ